MSPDTLQNTNSKHFTFLYLKFFKNESLENAIESDTL